MIGSARFGRDNGGGDEADKAPYPGVVLSVNDEENRQDGTAVGSVSNIPVQY